MTTETWPRPIPRGPAVGDTVELGTTRYRITGFHQTDDGMLARVHDGRAPRFVMAHELRWDGSVWRPWTEGELREAWGK